jgi:hypothetical protein
MNDNQWTQEQWDEHVRVNSRDSYSLMILATGLLIAENPDEDAGDLARNNVNGLSGFQFSGAQYHARHIRDLAQQWKAHREREQRERYE